MRNAVFLCLAVALAGFSQGRPQLNDGEFHGDAPYLLEDGWKPLLNGRDMSGWRAAQGRPNEWFTTRGVRFEPLLAPDKLFGVAEPGGAIVNGPAGKTANIYTDQKFGDMEVYLDFMVPKGSNSGVYLHGLYEIQVFDSYGTVNLQTSDGGAVYHRWIDGKPAGGSPPKQNASRRPGEWQSYQILFRAPRFDAAGKKTENARFVRVLHNGVLVQENVDLEGPTRAHMDIPEAAVNPLMLQGDHGPVAYRNIYWRPLRAIVKR